MNISLISFSFGIHEHEQLQDEFN